MFKDIQAILHRKLSANANAQKGIASHLTLINPAAELLEMQTKRGAILDNFFRQMDLSEENFSQYCRTLIDNILEFIQNLPDTRNSYYAQEGGMFDHLLQRTSIALTLCRPYFLPEGSAESSSLTKPQILWLYVIFSASLLQGIGKVISDFKISLYDQKANFLTRWQPLLGSMITQQGIYYSYEFNEDVFDISFRQRLTVLLARQLMPEQGMLWLSSDNDVLSLWLALLEEDIQATGTLGAILAQADAEAIQRYFAKLLAAYKPSEQGYKYSALSTTFVPSAEEQQKGKMVTQENAIEFMRWLTAQIENKAIMLNKLIFTVPGGLLIGNDVFKLFVREHPEFKNAQAIKEAVVKLGLHRIGADNNAAQASQSSQANLTNAKGIIFANPYLVLPTQVAVLENGIQHIVARHSVLQGTFSGALDQNQLLKHIAPNGKFVTAPALNAKEAMPLQFR